MTGTDERQGLGTASADATQPGFSVRPDRFETGRTGRFADSHPFVIWAWGLLRLDFTGIAFAALFFCWSLTPSLLPRDWLYQGLIGGISAAIGYGVGTAIGWVVDRVYLSSRPWWPPPRRYLLALKVAVFAVSSVAVIVMLVYSAGWQRELAALMHTEGTTTTTGYIRTGGLTMLVAAVIISVWRVLRDLGRLVAQFLVRWLRVPRRAALPLGFALVAVLTYGLVTGVLVKELYALANYAFSSQNDATRAGAVPPVAPAKSGSPASGEPWDTLGFEGRNFVSRGLDAQELGQANRAPAKEPIRVYAGLESAPTAGERMDLLVDELERTGAFDRKVLVIIPTTGTGWVNPTAAEAIELVHNGDTALVAAQYSYLPSWISFLADRRNAADAGKLLIDKVHERWLTKPPQTRPKLYVYGESLGTQSGEAAFGGGLAAIRGMVDGVLWVGPPNSNTLWRELVTRRDPGSPEVSPVYSDGLVVRFANDAAGIAEPPGPWWPPRVLYLQHPSDPVVWWSTDLIFERPDWLAEKPGADRLGQMRWFPFVTFWQVSADLANAAGVPNGHGHNYGTTVLDGWVAIAAPVGWTAADTERVRATLTAVVRAEGPEK